MLVFIGISVFSSKEVDVSKIKTELAIDASTFLKDFNSNNTHVEAKYIEKAIEVEGFLHKITFKNETYTLQLKGNELDIFALCQMRKGQHDDIINIKEGDKVRVKGILKGFLTDAILLNCIIINEVNE